MSIVWEDRIQLSSHLIKLHLLNHSHSLPGLIEINIRFWWKGAPEYFWFMIIDYCSNSNNFRILVHYWISQYTSVTLDYVIMWQIQNFYCLLEAKKTCICWIIIKQNWDIFCGICRSSKLLLLSLFRCVYVAVSPSAPQWVFMLASVYNSGTRRHLYKQNMNSHDVI